MASLRAIPNLLVLRPADAVETAECWEAALRERQRPSLLALSRQNLATLRTEHRARTCRRKGAYVLAEAEGKAQVTFLATGSEVEIAMKARELLAAQGVARARRLDAVLGTLRRARRRLCAADARPGHRQGRHRGRGPMGWDRYTGNDGAFIGMHGFGASAPYKELYKHFGITAEAAAEAALKRLKHKRVESWQYASRSTVSAASAG